ncbi:VOC family protein [Kutzneria sp. CA-103260]|uniref:VOC family protein n=1 Tax=Kutzneria sp. CA-103260 TaxID=2802641 RepID=UPI001BA81660|nr:VOC family protein [Kutzneria sp. CA-103260]QUQ63063.1 VOC family protein [Kutzneria sp. CA-103260]
MAAIKDLVVDCRHPASLARFWAAVLDDHAVAPYDEAALAQLRVQGITSPEDDPTVLLTGFPRIWFQLVPESKVVKNRMHLDLRTDDPTELDRLTSLGATITARRPDWVELTDPEGNEFCLFTDRWLGSVG